jgi:hypothetical protein
MQRGVLPLAELELRAVVDWVELRVRLPKPSQARHERARLPKEWGRPYVRPEGHQNASDVFRLRIQDPAGPVAILQQAQALCLPGDPAIAEHDIDVLGLEVSIDAYDDTGNVDALARAALHFKRHHGKPPTGGVRITERGHYRAAARPDDDLRALRSGATINAGARDADYRARYYAKLHDSRDGLRYAALPRHERRARFEVTLTGEATPFRDLAGWQAFRFETLTRLFALRRSTVDPSNEMMQMLREQQGRLGRPDCPQKRASHRRQSAPATHADTDTNERIRNSLRTLTRAQRSGNSVKQ